MHNTWNRVNNVFFFGLALLSFMCVLASLSTHYVLPQATPEINVLKVNELRRLAPFRGVDKAILTYDIDFDLSSVFNWNVKQLFVFLVAEYKSKTNEVNQVVVFDKIIKAGEDAAKNMKATFNKYPLVDEKMELRNVDVNYKLYWDIMPYFGSIRLKKGGSYSFNMPESYV